MSRRYDIAFQRLLLDLKHQVQGCLDFVGVTVLLVLDDLNPVVVRIENESHVLHSSIGETLLPVDIQRFESLAGGVQIVHRNA